MSAPLCFVVSDSTGRILRAGRCDPAALASNASGPGEAVLEVAEPVKADGTFWVLEGALVPGQVMNLVASSLSIAADGADECVITGLPDSCTVWVTGALRVPLTEVSGGSLTLTCSVPGVLILRFYAQGYADREMTIHAA